MSPYREGPAEGPKVAAPWWRRLLWPIDLLRARWHVRQCAKGRHEWHLPRPPSEVALCRWCEELEAGDRGFADEAFTLTRRVVEDDGRDPDALTGVPLETDEEFRARIREYLATFGRRS